MINKPIPLNELHFTLYLRSIHGSEQVTADLAVLADYNSDPDAFAAQHFGATVEDYTEWIKQDGYARCGGKTRKGELCKALVGGGAREIQEFLEVDRSEYCKIYGG